MGLSLINPSGTPKEVLLVIGKTRIGTSFLSTWLLILVSTTVILSCGPTEVSVEVDEVNVETEMNTSVEIPESSALIGQSWNLRTPISIPSPVGLEAMSEAIGGVAIVSDELSETVAKMGDILSSFTTPTPIPGIDIDREEERMELVNVLWIGFVVTSRTTDNWDYITLKESYSGFFESNGTESQVEVFIFDDDIVDPALASKIAVNSLVRNNFETGFHRNIVVSCEKREVCEELIDLLEEQSELLSIK